MKSIGDSGDPCGSPWVGVIDIVEIALSALIVINLFVRNELISLVKCVDVSVLRVCKILLCHVRSKACFMSSEIVTACLFRLKPFIIVCSMWRTFSVVSLYGRNAV